MKLFKTVMNTGEDLLILKKIMVLVLNMVSLSIYGISNRQLRFYNFGNQKDGS